MAIAGERTAATLARCTVFGEVRLDRLAMALSVLFRDPVHVAVPSEGELRFCHVPAESVTPTQERCHAGGAARRSTRRGPGRGGAAAATCPRGRSRRPRSAATSEARTSPP